MKKSKPHLVIFRTLGDRANVSTPTIEYGTQILTETMVEVEINGEEVYSHFKQYQSNTPVPCITIYMYILIMYSFGVIEGTHTLVTLVCFNVFEVFLSKKGYFRFIRMVGGGTLGAFLVLAQ